jgi:TetR/AcrR family transcriptional regulator, cholesterol catabolism regulator
MMLKIQERLDTPGQRRQAILQAATGVARESGYDGVRMRSVARRASVALGTLYSYFRSKHVLLVAVFDDWVVTNGKKCEEMLRSDNVGAHLRLSAVADQLTSAAVSQPGLTDAMIRAYLFADHSMSAQVEDVRRRLALTFANSCGPTPVTQRDEEFGYLLADVWTSRVLALTRGRATDAGMRARMADTIQLLSRSDGARRSAWARGTADRTGSETDLQRHDGPARCS